MASRAAGSWAARGEDRSVQCKWMWGDAGTRHSPFGHDRAKINPFRWSRYLDAQSCIQQLQARAGKNRPVRLKVKKMSETFEKPLPSIASAIQYLQEEVNRLESRTSGKAAASGSNDGLQEETTPSLQSSASSKAVSSAHVAHPALQSRLAKAEPMTKHKTLWMDKDVQQNVAEDSMNELLAKMSDIFKANNDCLLNKLNNSVDEKLEMLRHEVQSRTRELKDRKDKDAPPELAVLTAPSGEPHLTSDEEVDSEASDSDEEVLPPASQSNLTKAEARNEDNMQWTDKVVQHNATEDSMNELLAKMCDIFKANNECLLEKVNASVDKKFETLRNEVRS